MSITTEGFELSTGVEFSRVESNSSERNVGVCNKRDYETFRKIYSLFTLPNNNKIENFFKSVEPGLFRDCVDRGPTDKGAIVLVAILDLDPKRYLMGNDQVNPENAFSAVSFIKLQRALEKNAAPAEIADDCRHTFWAFPHRERDVLLARIRNVIPRFFPLIN